MAIWAVIPAAGIGARFGSPLPKQYLPLAGKSLILHSLGLFIASPLIDGIVVAIAANDREWPGVRPKPSATTKPLITTTGGASRAESVAAALAAIADRVKEDDWALVHDAARPCVAADDLRRLVDTLCDDPVGGILATPVADTLKRADDSGYIAATVERNGLWAAQTPQMFRYGLLRDALIGALAEGVALTDEAMAMERAGFAPRVVAARSNNLKVTRAEDLPIAEAVLVARGMIESRQ
jgi:2-C-methyl-D-erythritol 4-phosphate cytidylyltransferase